MATVLEPLLATMNYGNFSLKSSPFCGWDQSYCTQLIFFRLVSCLLNTDHYVSTPFNRVFNFEKFYAEMMPMLPKLKGASTLGSFFLAGQIKKVDRILFYSIITHEDFAKLHTTWITWFIFILDWFQQIRNHIAIHQESSSKLSSKHFD